MNWFHQLLTILHVNKNKNSTTINNESDISSSSHNKQTTIIEQEPVKFTDPIPENRQSVQIDQLEFEASRSLLNFFEPDPVIHPNFEHLLPPPKDVLPKKTISLRHKWSLYRPNKTSIKRSISTPNFLD